MGFLSRILYAFRLFSQVLLSSKEAIKYQSMGGVLSEAQAAEPQESIEIEKKDRKRSEDMHDAALYQLMSLFQREGRFIDFLKEDVQSYSDEEIGAVARSVHAGCSKVLQQHMVVESLSSAEEDSNIEIPEGFNVMEYRLIGDVQDSGPYSGVVLHQGWKIAELKMPQLNHYENINMVAPVEIEVNHS